MLSKSWTGDLPGNTTEAKIPLSAWPFLAMIVIGLLVPSTGGHSLLNPKSLILPPALFCTLFHAARRDRLQRREVITFLIAGGLLLLLAAAFCIFVANHPYDTLDSTADQFKVFVITISTTTMVVYWYLSRDLPFPTFLKTILWANMLFSLVKIGFVIGMVMGWLTIQHLMIVGSATMTTGMAGGLMRLQMSTDIPTPFLLFFALMAPQLHVKLSKSFSVCYVTTAIIAIFFSYSRFLWAVAAAGCLIYLVTTATAVLLLRRLTVLIVLIGVSTAYLGLEVTEELLYKRFLSEETQASDEVRVIQTEALLNSFEEAPFLGEGLGSHAAGSIRNAANPYLYEVQWLAFLMQFGILGFLCLLTVTASIGFAYLHHPIALLQIAFLGMYGLWLLSGLTNPFMISLNSGTLFGLFLICAWWQQQLKISYSHLLMQRVD